MDFIEELTWRGMIHQFMPGADEELKKGMATHFLGHVPSFVSELIYLRP